MHMTSEKFMVFTMLVMVGEIRAISYNHMGGAITFAFTNTSSKMYQVELTVVTGWLLSKGPCGTACDVTNLGRSSMATRSEMQRSDAAIFGKWTKVVRVSRYSKDIVSDITMNVTSIMKEYTSAVNQLYGWEQEIGVYVMEMDPSAYQTDIVLKELSWFKYDYGYAENKVYAIKTVIQAEIRSDTGRPNNSPVALFQPLYRILLNHNTTLKLTTMDVDGDYTRCEISTHIGAGGLKQLPGLEVHKDCRIVISAKETEGYYDGGYGVLSVKMIDFNRLPMLQGDDSHVTPMSRALSGIHVQFMIQTVKSETGLDPVFVEPTAESRHIFYVYLGSTLEFQLFAQPKQRQMAEIASFSLRSIPRRQFIMSPVKGDTTRAAEKVMYSTIKWSPGRKDIGQYLVGAVALDVIGMGSDERIYIIVVKDEPASNVTGNFQFNQHRPYFTKTPTEAIQCLQNSLCTFPVFAASNTGVIKAMRRTHSTLTNLTIGNPLSSNKKGEFVTDVSLFCVTAGYNTVCLRASDGSTESDEICVSVDVEGPDPCESDPCNSGWCNRTSSGYICICTEGYNGSYCENDIDECLSDPYPCFNGGSCYNHPAGSFLCICPDGYKGKLCDISHPCWSNPCQNGGACVDRERQYHCMCPLEYSGTECEERIPSISSSFFDPPSLLNGGTINCILGHSCKIPIYSHGNPKLLHGPKSTGISIRLSQFENVGNFKRATAIITAESVGHKKICLVVDMSPSIRDICYHLNVTSPDNLLKESVSADSETGIDISVMTTKLISGACLTDVIISPEKLTLSEDICVKSRSSDKGRCYGIQPVNEDYCRKTICAYGACIVERNLTSTCICDDIHMGKNCMEDAPCKSESCQNQGTCDETSFTCLCPAMYTGPHCETVIDCSLFPCQNNGICTPTGLTYTCVCPLGYVGTNCEVDSRKSQVTQFSSIHMMNGGSIICEVEKVCALPLYIQGGNGIISLPKITAGPQLGNVTVIISSLPVPVSPAVGLIGLSTVVVKLKAHSIGEKKVCIILREGSVKKSECFKVNVTETVPSPDINTMFKEQNVPDGSTLLCAENCHLLVNTKTLPDGSCDEIKTEDNYSRAFPTQKVPTGCLTDIVYTPGAQASRLCLEGSSSGYRLCYETEWVHRENPCVTEDCGNHGSCLRHDEKIECLCETGYTGAKCEDVTTTISSKATARESSTQETTTVPTTRTSTTTMETTTYNVMTTVEPAVATLETLTTKDKTVDATTPLSTDTTTQCTMPPTSSSTHSSPTPTLSPVTTSTRHSTGSTIKYTEHFKDIISKTLSTRTTVQSTVSTPRESTEFSARSESLPSVTDSTAKTARITAEPSDTVTSSSMTSTQLSTNATTDFVTFVNEQSITDDTTKSKSFTEETTTATTSIGTITSPNIASRESTGSVTSGYKSFDYSTASSKVVSTSDINNQLSISSEYSVTHFHAPPDTSKVSPTLTDAIASTITESHNMQSRSSASTSAFKPTPTPTPTSTSPTSEANGANEPVSQHSVTRASSVQISEDSGSASYSTTPTVSKLSTHTNQPLLPQMSTKTVFNGAQAQSPKTKYENGIGSNSSFLSAVKCYATGNVVKTDFADMETAMRAYNTGRMSCSCEDSAGHKRVVIRSRVSNMVLFRYCGIGFGVVQGCILLPFLLYLFVTNFIRRPPELGKADSEKKLMKQSSQPK